ncbi:hypothetical protein [Streptomyces xantholiticus]|uniref:Uncharacterized protein n=1 Tax=Streptomyces xantholiticus TaxID=68285 RepID=A0ABV1V3J8_9ACTN
MSAFASDAALDDVRDTTGNGTEVDVATNLLAGAVQLSILWTQEILLSPEDAAKVAAALARAADQGSQISSSKPAEHSEPRTPA